MENIWIAGGEVIARTNIVRGVEEGRIYRPLGQDGPRVIVTQLGDRDERGLPTVLTWMSQDSKVYCEVID